MVNIFYISTLTFWVVELTIMVIYACEMTEI